MNLNCFKSSHLSLAVLTFPRILLRELLCFIEQRYTVIQSNLRLHWLLIILISNKHVRVNEIMNSEFFNNRGILETSRKPGVFFKLEVQRIVTPVLIA